FLPVPAAPQLARRAMMPRLAADGVSFAFGERQVLADVSLELAAGELVAVLGPKGSGKSTPGRRAGRPGAVARVLARVRRDPRVEYAFTALEVTLMGRAPHQRGLGLPSTRDVAIARDAPARVDGAALAHVLLGALSGG